MFDIAFSELMIIAVAALVVLGPEKLPKVARQAGQWMGKLQRYVADVKSDINRQMELDELRKMQTELQETARSLETEVGSTVSQLRSDLDAVSGELSSTAAGAAPAGTIAPLAVPAEPEAATDWDRVYAMRRTRERIKERRRERQKELQLMRRLR